MIAAVAGRSLDDPDQRISLFAVGDDDQNIYAFAGASISFIRQFEDDYSAKPKCLTENYRSTRTDHRCRQCRDRTCRRTDEGRTRHYRGPGSGQSPPAAA